MWHRWCDAVWGLLIRLSQTAFVSGVRWRQLDVAVVVSALVLAADDSDVAVVSCYC